MQSQSSKYPRGEQVNPIVHSDAADDDSIDALKGGDERTAREIVDFNDFDSRV